MKRIKNMGANLNARRPTKHATSPVTARRGLTDAQQHTLLEVIAPGSEKNPFVPAVQNRNELIVLMLYHLGVRAGELLGLRVDDVNFQNNTVLIARQHGDVQDPRANQPVAKTADRRIPIADGLARRIADYVMKERRKVPGAKRHPYLFVTHRSGPFFGAPLSIPSLIKIFAEIQRAEPEHLSTMSAHVPRHTANDRFSALMDRSRVNSATEDKMRSYLMVGKKALEQRLFTPAVILRLLHEKQHCRCIVFTSWVPIVLSHLVLHILEAIKRPSVAVFSDRFLENRFILHYDSCSQNRSCVKRIQ